MDVRCLEGVPQALGLDDMPDSILLHVLGLGFFCEMDLEKFAYVNRRFCKLAHNMGLHCSLQIQGAHANTPRLSYAANHGRFRRLTSLSIQEAPFFSDEGLIAIASNCRNLCTVTLKRCAAVHGPGLAALIRACPALQTLQVGMSELGPLDAREICRAILGLPPCPNINLSALKISHPCKESADPDYAVPCRRHTADSDVYSADASALVVENRTHSVGSGMQPLHQAMSDDEIKESFSVLSMHADSLLDPCEERSFDFGGERFRFEKYQHQSSWSGGIQRMHSLQTIDLVDNRIGSAGGAAFAQLIRNNPPLETLGLFRNELGSAAVADMGVALSQNSNLKTLLLGANYTDKEYIQPSAVHALVQGLGQNSSLQILDLSLNSLDAKGFGESFRALNHASLRKVDLSDISDFFRCMGGTYSPFAGTGAGAGVICLQNNAADNSEV